MNHRPSSAWLYTGLFLVVVGLTANEWLIRTLFYDGVLWSVCQRVKTWILQVPLISVGFLLLFHYRSGQSLQTSIDSLIRNHRRKMALLLGLFLAGLLCVLLARVARSPEPEILRQVVTDVSTGELKAGFSQADPLLGYKPGADQQVRVQKLWEESSVYDAVYTFDSFARRYTPLEGPDRKSEFAIFAGCSFVFGEGVNDKQTLPYLYGKQNPAVRCYNYGFPGYGTQQMLAVLQERDLRLEVDEGQGTLIYIYLGFHVSRVIGRLSVATGWGEFMPYYAVDSDGELEHRGNFTSGRPVLSLLFGLAGKLALNRRFGIDYPRRQRPEDLELTIRIIQESQSTFLGLFPNSRFLVLLYPSRSSGSNIRPGLDRVGVGYLDYRNLFDASSSDFHIGRDGHPTPRAYELLARQLSVDLN